MGRAVFQGLQHNMRFDIVRIHYPGFSPIDIFDGIIWMMEEEIIDVAQYGQNLSCAVFLADQIDDVTCVTRGFDDKTLLVIRLNDRG